MQDLWDGRFGGEHYFYGTTPNAFLASQQALFYPGQKVLALADGEGRNGVWLAEQGADVLALDFSVAAMEKSRRLATQRGVHLRHERADVRDWTWGEERFDAIVAIFVQFFGSDLRPWFHRQMQQALRPGGVLILQGYRPRQLDYKTGGPSCGDNLYGADVLQADFAAMDILHLREHDSIIEEGEGHSGLSALVDLVARKKAGAA